MKPENLGLLLCRLTASAVLIVGVWSESARAAEEPVMFVLDASSTMQRPAKGDDGPSRLSRARDLIASIVEAEADRRDLGLIAFGGRDAKSCNDIETVAKLGTGKADFRLALTKLEATGEAPVAESLEVAVRQMTRHGKGGTIVLIGDGRDSCDADPCDMARDLRRKAPNIKMDAIGFASGRKGGVESLACVAEAGGGRFSLASDENELVTAMAVALGDTESLARALSFDKADESDTPSGPTLSLASPLSALAAPHAASANRKAPKISDVLAANVGAGLLGQGFAPLKDNGEPGAVTLSAAAAEYMEPLSSGVIWRVFKTVPDATGAHPLVTESRDAAPQLTLPPGDYIVHCAYGRAQAAKRIQVGGGAVNERLVLNAGALKLDAVVEDPGSADPRVIPKGRVSFTIYRGGSRDARGNALVVPELRSGETLRLTEGSYHIVSHFGDANATVRTNVRVEAGRLTEARVYHKAARVTLRLLSGPAGEALANTSWKVLDPEGGVVRESVGAFPSHILAAGDYTVVAQHDKRTYKSLISVQTGQNREIEVIAQE